MYSSASLIKMVITHLSEIIKINPSSLPTLIHPKQFIVLLAFNADVM